VEEVVWELEAERREEQLRELEEKFIWAESQSCLEWGS